MPFLFSLRARGLGALMTGALCVGAAGHLAAQSHCQFGPGSGSATIDAIPEGGSISRLGHPHFVCDDGVQIWADSAESFSAQNMTHLMGHVRYQDSTRVLRADDARYFSDVGRLQAFGHLFVRDTARGSVIRNGQLVYFLKSDSRTREQMTVTIGPDLVRPTALLYIRPSPDTARATRPDTLHSSVPDTTVAATPDTTQAMHPDTLGRTPGADTALASPPDTLRREPADTTPYVVVADRLVLEGNAYFIATGSAHIDRDSLHATADSVRYDQAAGSLLLQGWAKVRSAGYDLSGNRVDISMPGGEIRKVRAVHDAELTGTQLHMTAPTITVFMTDGQMDRLVATPLRPLRRTAADSSAVSPTPEERAVPSRGGARRPGLLRALTDTAAGARQAADSADQARPVATSEKFRLTADSLDVRAPRQVLDKMYAVGGARGESSSGDSLNVPALPEEARKDWIVGDTLISTFAKVKPKPGQPHDSVHYELNRLVAEGDASTLYRIAPTDSTFRPGVDLPAVHYVQGKDITIVLDSGQVSHMDVVDPKGWHFEPLPRAAEDSLAADSTKAADSAKARADTVGAQRDTAKARKGTAETPTDTAKAQHDTTEIRQGRLTPPPVEGRARRSGSGRGRPVPKDRERAWISRRTVPAGLGRGRR